MLEDSGCVLLSLQGYQPALQYAYDLFVLASLLQDLGLMIIFKLLGQVVVLALSQIVVLLAVLASLQPLDEYFERGVGKYIHQFMVVWTIPNQCLVLLQQGAVGVIQICDIELEEMELHSHGFDLRFELEQLNGRLL